MKTNLNWKKMWCDDKSAHWYSAKVPVIGWEYITDKHYNVGIDQGFIAGLYFGKFDDDITRFSNKFYKTEEEAMTACEQHLEDTAKKFNKWLNMPKSDVAVKERQKKWKESQKQKKIELISDKELLALAKQPKYAVYHKTTKLWVYFRELKDKFGIVGQSIICLCLKPDATVHTSPDYLKSLIKMGSFNDNLLYGMNNFLEFQIKKV